MSVTMFCALLTQRALCRWSSDFLAMLMRAERALLWVAVHLVNYNHTPVEGHQQSLVMLFFLSTLETFFSTSQLFPLQVRPSLMWTPRKRMFETCST